MRLHERVRALANRFAAIASGEHKGQNLVRYRGTASDALDFITENHQTDGWRQNFLTDWKKADLRDWPAYRQWLAKRQSQSSAQDIPNAAADAETLSKAADILDRLQTGSRM